MAGRGWGGAMIQVVLVVRRDHRRPSGASRRAQTGIELVLQGTSPRLRARSAGVGGGHEIVPWRSTVLVSSCPATLRARTTKYTVPPLARSGVRNEVTPGVVV